MSYNSKRTTLVCLLLCILLFCGCVSPISLLSTPGLIDVAKNSEDLLSALCNAKATPITPKQENAIHNHIVMDAHLLKDGQGFFASGCNTLANALSAYRNAISDTPFTGYITCKEEPVYAMNATTQQQYIVGETYYTEFDSFFSQVIRPRGQIVSRSTQLAETIEQITANASADTLYTFITELAFSRENDAYLAIDSLIENVASRSDITLGMIALKGDYKGKVSHLPVTNYGVDLSGNRVHRKPVYFLFFGAPDTVFETMDQLLTEFKNTNVYQNENDVKTVFYYNYECNPIVSDNTVQQVSVSYNDLLARYAGKGSYDCSYVFDVEELDGTKKVDASAYELLSSMPLSKVYAGITAETSPAELTFSFPYPYTFQGATGSRNPSILADAPIVSQAEITHRLIPEISRMGIAASNDTCVMTGWQDTGNNGFSINATSLSIDKTAAKVSGTLDLNTLAVDEPALYSATFRLEAEVPTELLASAYDMAWMEEWEMDIERFSTQFSDLGIRAEEAVKTPYLSNIFAEAFLTAHISKVQKTMLQDTNACARSAVFGLILREQAIYYDQNSKLEESDNLGWAFSRNDIIEISSSN